MTTASGMTCGVLATPAVRVPSVGSERASAPAVREIAVRIRERASHASVCVTASYNAATNEVNFVVPDDLVQIGDPVSTIRLRVEVASNCFDFVDACSHQIQNLAYSTYQGEINTATITDDPFGGHAPPQPGRQRGAQLVERLEDSVEVALVADQLPLAVQVLDRRLGLAEHDHADVALRDVVPGRQAGLLAAGSAPLQQAMDGRSLSCASSARAAKNGSKCD